jgi:thiol-disulfide isomerase/thioredoxin
MTSFSTNDLVRAPAFPTDLDWINTNAPLRLEDLRGKFVLLDFFSYGCINCQHLLPTLRQLEAEFGNELVIVGVHAGKYPNERRTPHLEQAALRLGIEHPILNDRKYRTWRTYTVSAWPTLVLIDPRGRYLGDQSGETTAEFWRNIIQPLISIYTERGEIDRHPLHFAPLAVQQPQRPLQHPDKVLVVGDQLFIADTGHNRIVVAQLIGERAQVTHVIGSGTRGRVDGAFGTATFNLPRGMVLVNNTLYVADTGNHLVRAVDLEQQTVRTVAGTGERGVDHRAKGPGTEIDIASPWDLALHNGLVVIAMAGMHQLWSFDPHSGMLAPLAGNSRESVEDGPLMAAVLAQPSGVTSDGQRIFFADSESQAIRQATLGSRGEVTTLVGTGLFDWGDKDGVGDDVLLQHPQAIMAHGGDYGGSSVLYIADTYNHKIKILDPHTRACHTWLGKRRIPGHDDGAADEASFYEPGGLAIANNTLYIADTNNHAIRTADLETGEVRTLQIEGI